MRSYSKVASIVGKLRNYGGPVAFGATLIVIAWTLIIFHLDHERANTERAAIQNSSNLVGAFEEHLSRSLNEIDRTIKLIRAEYVRNPENFSLRGGWNGIPLFDDQTLQVSIVSPDGFIRLSSIESSTSIGTDLRDREHFQSQSGAKDDQLLISKPVIGRTTGKWSIQLTRRIEKADGSFNGMIVVSLDPAYLARFYNSVDIGADGYVRVIGVDGVIRAAGAKLPALMALDLSRGDLFKRVKNNTTGWFYTASNVSDHIPRLVTFRALKSYPLVITVGLSKAEIFSGIEARRTIYYLVGLVLTGLAVAVTVITIKGRMLRDKLAAERDIQNRRLEAVLSNMPLGVIMIDDAGCVAVANDRYRKLYGMDPDLTKPGAPLSEIIRFRKTQVRTFANEPETFYSDILRRLSQGEVVKDQRQLDDGRIISIMNQPVDGGGWVSIHEDATEQLLAKERLQQTKRFLDTVIENVPIPIVVKDAASLKFVLVNQAYEAFVGRSRESLLGSTVFDLFSPDAAERVTNCDREAIRSNELVIKAEFAVETPQHDSRFVTTTRMVVSDADRKPLYVIAVIEDITEKRRDHAKIAYMAHHDPLTDLCNRAHFSERLDEVLNAISHGAKLAVLFLDLDHFKTINDTLGHLAGDELLKVVAERLRGCVKPTDVVARLGGDEFAIVQTGIDDNNDTAMLADRIRAAVTAPYDIEGFRAVIDVSIGIAFAPDHGRASVDLMKRADLALYKAKSDGRGTFRSFEPEMDARMKAWRMMETDLRSAISNGELELFYQPIVHLQDGAEIVSGVEALLRWNHPHHGIILPGEFIPVAEDTGLIVPLGEWVVRKACAEAVNWPENINIAINLSPIQLTSPNLIQVVVNALAATGIAPSRLELEITEATLLGNSQSNLAILDQFRKLGVRIVMDDFGTGYSSLNYLRCFAFDKIKIDRSFVSDLRADNHLSLAIVEAVAKFAGALKVSTTAEGVETEEQLKLVRAAGCTHCQGYLFSPPVPASEITKLFLTGTTASANVAA